jgi:hypothetical protein
MPIQTAIDSISNSQGSPFGFKNRIMNGGMVIDQRNAGASVTGNDGVYGVDRWRIETTQSSKLTMQQNAGSVTPPPGFQKYIGVTSSSSYSITSTDRFTLAQWIEGHSVADLDLGTSTAKTFTLSFWVRSSLTGTFGGCCIGYDQSSAFRSYTWNYTISQANTWEYKTITIPGDTTAFGYGKTNNFGLYVGFSLGHGSTFRTAPNTWTSGLYYAPTTHNSVVGTNGATLYITGVQVELGSQATSFDWKPYTTELQLCQRYCQVFRTTGGEYDYLASGAFYNSTQGRFFKPLLVTMRVSPTFTVFGTTYVDAVNYILLNSLSLESSEPESIRMGFTASSAGSNATGYGCFLASSTSSTERIVLSADL